jgi:hypothetical protein
MQDAIWSTSVALGTESPDKVAANFFEILKRTGPFLNAATTIIVPWAMLITAFWKYDWLCKVCKAAKDYVEGLAFASVSIPGDHALHQQILYWVLEDGRQSQIRALALTTRLNIDPPPFPPDIHGGGAYIRPPKRKSKTALKEAKQHAETLAYIPDVGKYHFRFRGHFMTLLRNQPVQRERLRPQPMYNDGYGYDSRQREDDITISSFSPWSGTQPIREFLDHIQTLTSVAQEDKTMIYRPGVDGRNWDNGVPRIIRNLDAVTLQQGVKEALVADVQAYLHPNTKRYYSNRGIPWRRGYLFYGPPGTGKV